MKKWQKMSSISRKKLSESKKWQVSPRKWSHLSDETKQKLSDANLGKTISEETRIKIGNTLKGRPVWNTGKRYSSPKQSLAISWDKNPNWKWWISFEEYSGDWTDDLKESIRKRDWYVCQECGIHQDELVLFYKKLDVHHIDYNKYNLEPSNLVTLCRSCHMKTNYNREEWIKYFNNKVYE